jgi:hypothetical protein
MSNLSSMIFKPYADRPATPLGEATGLTSTPVSEHPSRRSTPPPSAQGTNPYHYQPAIASSRPELAVLRRNSSNYIQASAAEGLKFSTTDDKDGPSYGHGRTKSFSAEDLKRREHEHLMTMGKEGEKEEGEEKMKSPLQSPGIGNSEVMGREFGFTSAE